MPEKLIEFYSGADSIQSISATSNSQVRFTLVNDTGENIAVYWIDYSGNEILYRTLDPGGEYTQPTYSAHAWAVRDTSGQALFKFYTSQTGIITAHNDSQDLRYP